MNTFQIEPRFQPPEEADAYLSMAVWNRRVREQYFGPGANGGSSRINPCRLPIPPEGTWQIDEMRGLYGHEVEVLCMLDPRSLLVKEDMVEHNIEGRRDDAERYAEWYHAGLTPPPISVVQLADGSGRLAISDGHRRAKGAEIAGCKVPAWVSPVMQHPLGLIDTTRGNEGKVMLVGMTYEGMTGREFVNKAAANRNTAALPEERAARASVLTR